MMVCPAWIEAFAKNRKRGARAQKQNVTPSKVQNLEGLGPRPDWLPPGDDDVGAAIEAAGRPVLHQGELERLCSALAVIPADCGYGEWVDVGLSLHATEWGDAALAIWDRWSRRAPHRYPGFAALEHKWASFGKDYNGPRRTVASIYHDASARGWLQVPPVASVIASQTSTMNGTVQALPAQLTTNPIQWLDVDRGGNPKPTCANTRVALQYMGIECRHDLFHHRQHINGESLQHWQGELADDTVLAVRAMIRTRWPIDPTSTTTRDALMMECQEHAYDPVLDYLDGLQWDGHDRLGTWLHDYLGAEASPLNRMIGGLSLVAAVRRARRPGAKFDHVIVLEGLEGMGKSSAVSILAGAENFSDQEILTLNDRAQQEQVQGIWLYEIAELAGMHRADVERVKAFVTRTVDRARPAYGHFRVDRPRRCVFFASCNTQHYLLAQTGNRRFWPVQCELVKIDGLVNARDQLWAQAAAIEKRGMGLHLPEQFWPLAARMQESRRMRDPWEEFLTGVEENNIAQWFDNEARITTEGLLTGILKIVEAQQTPAHTTRLGIVMRLLGWDGPKLIRMRITEQSGETVPKRGYTLECNSKTSLHNAPLLHQKP